jgi:flagellin-like hook-associated protein FlgL
VLADITEEGANLVALQTRQQLGISALSFAGNSEQSILSLFR